MYRVSLVLIKHTATIGQETDVIYFLYLHLHTYSHLHCLNRDSLFCEINIVELL